MTLRTTTLLMALTTVAGCEPTQRPCNPYVQQDQKLTVTVEAPYGEVVPAFAQGLPSCGLDDIHPGDNFDLQLSDHIPQGGFCYDFACPPDFPEAARYASEGRGRDQQTHVCLSKSVNLTLSDQCTLGRFVSINTSFGARELFGEPDPSNPFVLLRMLSTTTDGKPCADLATRFPSSVGIDRFYVCADQWQVRLSKR